jgi:hypothetical protein
VGNSSGHPDPPAPGRPPLELRLLLTLSLAVIVAVASVAIVTLLSPDGSSTPQVTTTTIQGVGFGWASPSTEACSNSVLFWTESPRIPFTTSSGATFNVSYQMICEPNASAPSTSYEVYSAASASPGVNVIASNVPVEVGSTAYSWLNVTVHIINAQVANSITIEITTTSPGPSNQ